MTDTTSSLIDRRRLRRKLTIWRIVAVIAVVAAIFAATAQFGGEATPLGAGEDQIARIAIEGTILENKELIERIERAGEAENVKAIILTIDSPGGTTVGGEAIHEAIKAAKAEKPVVAEVGTLAASAGYMLASATDHIVARQTSLVGSIGVVIQGPNFAEALDKLGISFESFASAPLKAEPSPFNETTPAERDAMLAVIADSYAWFVDLVAENRNMSREEVLRVATGAIFTGRQALENGLIDALGGEDSVRAYLTSREIDADLEIVDWRKPSRLAEGWIAGLFKPASPVAELTRELGLEHQFLDGLVSVWQGLPHTDGAATRP